MTKENKIVKHELESEVNDLLDNGYSVYKISDLIKNKYSDKKDLRNISPMSIQRYKDTRSKRELIDIESEGRDPTDIITKQFMNATEEFLDEVKFLTKESKLLYKEAKKEGTLIDRAKILKELRDNINQKQKIWESKMNYGTRQMRNLGDINQKKVQNLNVIMIDIANDLCPDCRMKALNKLAKLAD